MGPWTPEIAYKVGKILGTIIFNEISTVREDFNRNFIITLDYKPSNSKLIELLKEQNQ